MAGDYCKACRLWYKKFIVINSRRVWLVGGGSGIGRELALKLCAAGNQVVISGRGIDSLQEVALAGKTNSTGANEDGKIFPLVYDVTDDEQSKSIALEVAALIGGIDILVYCAGRCEYIDDAELSVELFRRVYEVNVFGMVSAISAALPLMRQDATPSTKPQVVGVASLSAVVGLPRAEAYGSSKAAANYLLNALRVDLDQYHVDVTVVNPGFVETPMTETNDFPMPFIMSASDAADCILKGIEKRKRVVNFPWALLLSLKLGSLFPALWYGFIGPRLARRDASVEPR